jgi:FkbM family methyltransferase
MLKSALLNYPAVYEIVQQWLDAQFLRQANAAGTYAQHGEDLQILRILQACEANGPFLDVGCNHPFKISNTYLLYRHGYRGLCVDPLPRYRSLFERWRPQDRFVRIAIAEVAGELPFFEFESDVLSTLDPLLAALYERQGYRLRKRSSIRVERLDTVLEESGLQGPISLLSIDIEGHELSALKSLDLDRWQPTLICLEVSTADGRRDTATQDYLQEYGYTVALDLGLNLLLTRFDLTIQPWRAIDQSLITKS